MNSHTLATTLATARAIATTRRRPRRKVEKAYDTLVSGEPRYIEREIYRTRGGQPATVADVVAIDRHLREVLELRDDVERELAGLTGKARSAARRALHQRLNLACATVLDGFGASDTAEPQPVGRDLRPRDIAGQAAQLAQDDVLYAGGFGITADHVDALRASLRARGLALLVVGVHWYRVTKLATATGIPSPSGACVACGGSVWCGRCRRCGTREASRE